MLANVQLIDASSLINLQEGREKRCGPKGLPHRESKDDVCRFVFYPTLLELPEDFDAEEHFIDLENLQAKEKAPAKKGGKKTHVGVLRGKGELHITGDNDFEAIDLDKTSVTTFTNLLML